MSPDAAARAVPLREAVGGGFYLHSRSGRIELCREGAKGGVCLDLDAIARRVRQGARLDLARACGCRPGLTILDAMAGFGVDGLTLAALGCRVRLVERSPVMYRLLVDGATRWAQAGGASERIDLVYGDATDSLKRDCFDVVYLDPMFAARTKSALPNKRAQFLAELLVAETRDVDPAELQLARAAARSRVVLKRRRTDPEIAPPDWQILGRSVRFDVYRGAPRHT